MAGADEIVVRHGWSRRRALLIVGVGVEEVVVGEGGALPGTVDGLLVVEIEEKVVSGGRRAPGGWAAVHAGARCRSGQMFEGRVGGASEH